MEKVDFEIKLVHNKPVDLIQMANSLISLQNIVSSFVGKENGIKDSKILLKGVKEGSDIYQLALDFGVGVLPIIDGVNTISEAINHIKSYLNIDKQSIKELRDNKHYNSVNCDNIKNFVAPVLNNDDNSKVEVTINGNNNSPIIIINNQEAKKIDENTNFIKKLVSLEEERENQILENALIRMHVTVNSTKQVKDKAYCDIVLKGKAVPTVFQNPEDKKEVLNNSFSNILLVDIEIMKADNEIKLYRVLKLHNIIPLEIE